jgi:hypothetical protein
MIKNKFYSGALQHYTYPEDNEYGTLLSFLKKIKTNKRIHLTDGMDWQQPLPTVGYDMYIVCAFGEFINEKFMNTVDSTLKNIVLITSQYFTNTKYKNTQVFYVEHLHTIIRFFDKIGYAKIKDRPLTHGSLSRRNSLHKTLITAKLLNKFKSTYDYTFCDLDTVEYSIDTLDTSMKNFYPFLNLTPTEVDTIKFIHQAPRVQSGEQWSIDNDIYKNCKVIWTTESIFLSRDHAPTAYLTEKVFKSIISGSAFVLVSQRDSLARLKSLGFVPTYDLKSDQLSDSNRFAEIFDLIDNFVLPELQDIVDHNYNYFWNGFHDHVEQMNLPLIEQVINYINET